MQAAGTGLRVGADSDPATRCHEADGAPTLSSPRGAAAAVIAACEGDRAADPAGRLSPVATRRGGQEGSAGPGDGRAQAKYAKVGSNLNPNRHG